MRYKRLDRGTLRIPLPVPPGVGQVSMTERELRLLLEGIDEAVLRQARRTARAARPVRWAPTSATMRDHV